MGDAGLRASMPHGGTWEWGRAKAVSDWERALKQYLWHSALEGETQGAEPCVIS